MPPLQPIPQATPDDIVRVVSRDFSENEYSTVMTILGEYGTEAWHREPDRVRLAALKLANGSVQKLRVSIERAKRDYRDVIAPAEYPGHSKVGWTRAGLPPDEKRRIFQSDWQQYEQWLKKTDH
jgi:hypothetical protein